MKIKATLFGTATLVAVVSLSMTSCRNSGQEKSEGEHEHAGEHAHPESAVAGGAGEEGEHSHAGGGHMQHMVDVKNWLKEELKGEYDQPVPPASQEQLALGKEVYARTCVACHGEGGKGDGPASVALGQKPADFTDSSHSKYYSDRGRIHIIKKGVVGTPMVGWESALSEDEIQSVYGYIVSLRVPETEGDHASAEGKFTCPMHPEVASAEPGKCPKCGMTLKMKEHDQGEHKH